MALKITIEAYGVIWPEAYLRITRFEANYAAPESAVEYRYQVFADAEKRQLGAPPLIVVVGQCSGADISGKRQMGDDDPRQPVYRWLADNLYPGAENV